MNNNKVIKNLMNITPDFVFNLSICFRILKYQYHLIIFASQQEEKVESKLILLILNILLERYKSSHSFNLINIKVSQITFLASQTKRYPLFNITLQT